MFIRPSADKSFRKQMICVFLLLLAVLLCSFAAGFAEEPLPSAFRLIGVPHGKSASVRSTPAHKGEVLFTLEAGESCEIIGQKDKYYIVKAHDWIHRPQKPIRPFRNSFVPPSLWRIPSRTGMRTTWFFRASLRPISRWKRCLFMSGTSVCTAWKKR